MIDMLRSFTDTFFSTPANFKMVYTREREREGGDGGDNSGVMMLVIAVMLPPLYPPPPITTNLAVCFNNMFIETHKGAQDQDDSFPQQKTCGSGSGDTNGGW
jgi:hypothetical protein